MLKKTFLTFVFLTLLTTFYGLNANFGPYGNRTAGSFIGSAERTEIAHTISVYDELIRSVSEEEGYDWRLMSAIAYHESRFSPDIVSKRGAAGLMQIMPAVARQFNVTGDRLLDPETNVRLAAQVLSKIDAGLHFAPGTPDDDRMSIILAAYNGGIGHVNDARRLARSHGENPDSWETVARYLALKALPEYYEQQEVRCGRFTGGSQTRAYVRDVLKRYDRYCRSTLRTRSRFRNRKQRGSLPRCFFIELPPAEIQYAPCGNQRPTFAASGSRQKRQKIERRNERKRILSPHTYNSSTASVATMNPPT